MAFIAAVGVVAAIALVGCVQAVVFVVSPAVHRLIVEYRARGHVAK